MKLGIASRPALDQNTNGDDYLVKEWNGQTLLVVIDGLGHGEEAAVASTKARQYVLENHTRDVEQIVSSLHTHLRGTRGVVAGAVRIDRTAHRLIFCGIGNVDVSIVAEPPMHPTSLDGILGVNARKIMKFGYTYDTLRAVVLYSDGVSGRFSLSDYPLAYEQPQFVAERILDEWGNRNDDATIAIAVENEEEFGSIVEGVDASSDARAMTAAEKAEDLAKKLGFSEADQSKIAISTSELAKNIVAHAHGAGRIAIKPIEEGDRVGIVIIADDSGPGIADVEKALEGGFSTKRGLGIGLGGAKRLMDEFSIETEVGRGTRVTIKKWKA
ncbi:MAG: ATP-binding protein [Promethearchaeati archaeon SRVP18_Atabeyarchaeia-1]